ncbi:MAG TPA: hypothetical protein VGL99_14255 [Chloroflexota bacterium]|jgi:hypothetical protein
MAEPLVVDIRKGLTEDILDGLRRAERVLLAAKGLNTGALGYWIDDQLTIAILDCAMSRIIRLPARSEVLYEVPTPFVPGRQRRLTRSPMLDIATVDNEFWSRVLGVLRVGDVLRVAPDPDHPGNPALYVSSHGIRVALLRLPRPREHRESAA